MTRSVLGVGVLVAVASATSALAAGNATSPGEVYRVWLDGRRIDLTRSPADDTFPVVSRDGRRVAFVKHRGDSAYLYTVDSGGGGVKRLSSALPAEQSYDGQIAWAPDGRRLVVAASGSLYLIGPGHRQRLIAHAPTILGPAWSPDGRLIAFRTGDRRNDRISAVTPAGRRAWRVRGSRFAWSGSGRIAVQVHGRRATPETVRVHGAGGRLLAAFPARSFAWSASGDRLASVVANHLEVHAGGGRLLFTRALTGLHAGQSNGLVWASRSRVVIGGLDPPTVVAQIGVDIQTGRTWRVSSRYFGVLSPNRTLVAEIAAGGRGFVLRVTRLDGGRARTLARRSPCPDLVEGEIDWLPDGRSLVYAFKCQPKRP